VLEVTSQTYMLNVQPYNLILLNSICPVFVVLLSFTSSISLLIREE